MAAVSVVVINKREPSLAETLDGLRDQETKHEVETVVVDASDGALDHLRDRVPGLVWIPFAPRPDKAITIAEQRNVGVAAAQGELIVFIDSGCTPVDGWLDTLVEPLAQGLETVTVGRTDWVGPGSVYTPSAAVDYVDEAPTINLAFTRAAFDQVGGFDEDFDYGSDIDFTWRLREHGHRLRWVDQATIRTHAGSPTRQVRRAYLYGQSRARLYAKHLRQLPSGPRRDPILFAYPAFLALLPLTLLRRFRWYPLLLAVPLWRARRSRPLLTVADHLAYGLGALTYWVRALR